jgi:hypothetical protein
MSRRWVLAGAGVLLAVAGGVWLAVPPPVALRPAPERPAPVQPEEWAEGRVTVALAGQDQGLGAPSSRSRPREPREYLASRLPAQRWLGRVVQTALTKPGDSDPRLLDGMATLGIRPSWGASWGAWLDPWLAVGLVDLERQMARRCEARGGQGCFEGVLSAERALGDTLGDHPAGAALALFHQRDLASYGGEDLDGCQLSADALRVATRYDVRAAQEAMKLLREGTGCPRPDPASLAALQARMRAQPERVPAEAWAQVLDWSLAEGDAETARWAYQGLAGTGTPGEEALARARAHLVGKGWLEPVDWRDALRVAALHCDPGPSSAPLRLEVVARFDGGVWTLGEPVSSEGTGAEAYVTCIERTVGEPAPAEPTEVDLLIRR